MIPENSKLFRDLLKIGKPEKCWAGIGQRDDRGQFLDTVLLAPTKGYVAEVVIDKKPDSDQVEIKASTPIFRVTCFSPDMYEELLETRILIDKLPRSYVPFENWLDYGSIPVKRE